MFKPPVHRGMKELDRAAFNLTVPLVAVRVPTKTIGQIKAKIPNDVFKAYKQRNVVNDESSTDHKIMLLDPSITNLELTGGSDTLRKIVEENKLQTLNHPVTLTYEHWSADEILKAVLPDPNEAPTSYEQIGHIAHMNLRDQYLEYKSIIGQVILDKSPTVTMVVNKLDTIDNTFRNFKMEVLAGKQDFMAQVRENECLFRFDYSKVYWNSRLHGEHERLIAKFAKGSSVCDVMAGVGPFAVPAAKKGCLVWANDLNPASYEALKDNTVLNKVQDRLTPFNMDGREFIRQAFAQYRQKTAAGQPELPPLPRPNASRTKAATKQPEQPIPVPSKSFDHVVMNLPAIALEFLDAFRGIFSHIDAQNEEEKPNLPTIHVHCFTKSDEPEKDILQRACRALGYPEADYKDLEADVFYVRRVAPNKDMYCLSVKLPEQVAYMKHTEVVGDTGAESDTGNKRKSQETTPSPVLEPKVAKTD
ncbi:tRNA(m(1)G37)methyltransferase [Coemansia sp. Benny D115]|nr:tRNA(m(1)G37)methyltransferase [Coemansia sp. Benny D115]